MSAPGPTRINRTNTRADWRTPPEVFEYWDNRFHFTIDAAASKENALCKNYYDIEFDSLNHEWNQNEVYWINPPYGSNSNGSMLLWIRRIIRESEHSSIVALLPSATGTRWFEEVFANANEIVFYTGRLGFIDPETNEPAKNNPSDSLIAIFSPSERSHPLVSTKLRHP